MVLISPLGWWYLYLTRDAAHDSIRSSPRLPSPYTSAEAIHQTKTTLLHTPSMVLATSTTGLQRQDFSDRTSATGLQRQGWQATVTTATVISLAWVSLPQRQGWHHGNRRNTSYQGGPRPQGQQVAIIHRLYIPTGYVLQDLFGVQDVGEVLLALCHARCFP